MDNRFLSKAKRIDNGEWVTGYYLPYIADKGTSVETGHAIACSKNLKFWLNKYNYYDIDVNTLCQCTGIEVKNGILYEGDWIYDGYGPMISICAWTDKGFKWKTYEGIDINNYSDENPQIEELDEVMLSFVKIKGNIHDKEVK